MTASTQLEACFPLAAGYRRLSDDAGYDGPDRGRRVPRAGAVGEGPMAFAFSERHLKCAWFDNAVRPAHLRTQEGDELTIEHPGRWNLEAGPDFLGARLRLEPERRRLVGDVEVHIRPSDWCRHGHPHDPAYRRVVAHVTWFPGRLPEGSLPAGAVQVALRDPLSADPLFSFESLDLAAYPFVRRGADTPCARRLAGWPPEDLAALLDSAGEERLRRKAERLALAARERGANQALYEELMSALGYKHNRSPFRALARACPLADLREESGRDAFTAYALLLGLSGLLPAQTDRSWDPETRTWVRQLWNRWWKLASRWNRAALDPAAWKLGGLRPANHPRRRLWAAAGLFTRDQPPAECARALPGEPPAAWLERIPAWLQPDPGAYWRHRLALGGRRQRTTVALVGAARAAGMIVNALAPFQAAAGPPAWSGELLRLLPPGEDNGLARQAAANLLGPDHNPRLYRNGLRQQGLLQLFADFCLDDRSGCAACRLVKSLEAYRVRQETGA